MLRPHSADFLWCSEFAALDLSFRLGEVSFLLRRQLDRRLIDARKLQHNSRQLILPGVRQGGHCAESFIEKTGHSRSIATKRPRQNRGL